jgi:hypothetical protein
MGRATKYPWGYVTAEFTEQLPLLPFFHPFGDRTHAKLPGNTETGLENGAAGAVGVRLMHESAVDLELVERDVAQLRERGMPRAEIVDGESDVLQPNAREHVEHRERIAHQPAFGDLQYQQVRRQSGVPHRFGNEVGKLE